MMRLKPLKLLLSLAVGITAFLGAGSGHAIASNMAMPDMGMGQMGANQCQSNCNAQPQPVAGKLNSEVKREDHDPQPAIPYYLQFATVGWVLIVSIAAAFLFKYLRWRPPDFIKLYAVYRF